MYKIFALIKKKNGMSMADFIDYYETSHAPLAAKTIPNLKKYVRHFLRPYGNDSYQAAAEQNYHVVTELWFEDKATCDAAMAAIAEPRTAAILNADGENLFELSSIRFLVAETHETALAKAAASSRARQLSS